MVNKNATCLKINIFLCQTVQFTNAKTCSQKNYNIIIVIILTILLYILQMRFLLRIRQCSALFRIVLENVRNLKLKRIFTDNVIINRHFKSRTQNTMKNSDGITFTALIVQTDIERFCIRWLHQPHFHLSERILLDPVDCCSVSAPSILSPIPF